jgi:hypothetical protein
VIDKENSSKQGSKNKRREKTTFARLGSIHVSIMNLHNLLTIANFFASFCIRKDKFAKRDGVRVDGVCITTASTYKISHSRTPSTPGGQAKLALDILDAVGSG